MESTSAPNRYNADQPSNSEDFIGSSSLTADEYLRPSKPRGGSLRRPFAYETEDFSSSLTADEYLRPSKPRGGSLRRPFAYETYSHPSGMAAPTIGNNSSVSLDSHASTEEVLRDQNMAIRYRFFNRLDPGGNRLAMPDHVVPGDFYSVLPLDDFKDESGKQDSIVTIFSVWNTMMGSSLLAMPWAVQQAGLLLGIFLILAVGALSLYTAYRIVQSPVGLMWNTMMGSSLLAMPWAVQQAGLLLGIFLILAVGALSLYTAYRIVQSPVGLMWNTMMGSSLLAMPWAVQQAGLLLGIFLILAVGALSLYTAYRIVQSPVGLTLGVDSQAADLPDVCRYFWGSVGDALSVFFSVVVLLGGIVVYWVLMSNFLYYTGNVIHEAMQPNSTTIPILENKTFTCDIYCPGVPKYSEELDGVVNYFSNLPSGLANRDFFTFDNLWKLQGSVPIYLAVVTLPLLSFKSATFFTKFNMLVFRWRFPALTGTLTLSYFLHNVVLTILRNQKHPENNARDLSIGYSLAAFTYVFTGSLFFLLFPTIRTCISDNFLNNFGSGDAMSATARLFLLFQMMTVLPLLAYLVRAQFFYATLGTVYPGMGYVFLLNVAVLSLAVCVAIFYPHVGSIIRFVGSFSGLVYIFALPCTIHLKRLHMRGTLTRFDIAIHGTIIFLGAANFFTQFFL
uniref:Amino acid transporter transmembrane domain-containing protein n=1 Tax=Ascaris lumbricoides TaxID=6252 RepID=A0A9J2PTM1_ASCLU